MKYLYYPGCSLEGTAKEYGIATQALMEAMDAAMLEIDDWTCCGASAAESKSSLLALVLPAINLAKAERMDPETDVLAPCSACYLNLKKAEIKSRRDSALLNTINEALKVEGLNYQGKTRVRHLLDVLINDIGPDSIRSKVKKPLTGLRIAPYYGCQCLRPYSVFDDPERPESMEPLLKAAGADIFPWEMGPRCCGAALLTTKREDGLKLVSAILEAAKGADAIATVCPMCQMNLEAFQKIVSRQKNEDLSVSVLYLPQLLGAALGIDKQKLRLDLNLAVSRDLPERLELQSLR